MDRREVLQVGAAVVASGALAGGAAQAQTAPKLTLSAYSRTLHWLRTPQEVAAALNQIGNKTVDLTVRPGSGHVDPAKVKTDLPVFVKGLRAGGVDVSMLAPNILDADDANAEATLDAASQLGIHHYWWGTYRFDETKPYWPQLDALKPKVAKLVALNQKYGMKAMAHPRDGAGSVSGAFFDLYYVLKDFDPRYVSFQYDTHHLAQAFDSVFVQQLRMGGAYIGGFVWKDVMIESPDSPNPDDAWRAAHPRPARAAAAAAPADAVAGPAGAAAGAPGAAPAGRGGRGGRGPNANPSKIRVRQVPVGTGQLNLKLIAQTLKEINFNGPMECEPEWPQLGGADGGATELSISREECIALLKKDRVTMEGIMASAGLI